MNPHSCLRRNDWVKARVFTAVTLGAAPTAAQRYLEKLGLGVEDRYKAWSTAAQRYLEKLGLGVEDRYKACLKDGNPSFSTVSKIFRALDLKQSVQTG